MELWIRSQDKENLIKVIDIKIKEMENRTYKYGDIGKSKEFAIVSNNIILGYYETKARALEVLDEIQFAILCSGATWEEAKGFKEMIKSGRCSINVKTGAVIYEMPKE